MQTRTNVKFDSTFHPPRLFRNKHAQTILPAFLPRPKETREARHDEARIFRVAADVAILARCRWQKERAQHATLLLIHGLEGSSESSYMLGLASKAFRRGFNVVRLNVRNCGGTEHLTPTLYNSGLSADVRAVIAELVAHDSLPRIFLAGVSMGGNIVLKLAGEYGLDAPREVNGLAAVSPSMDLPACVEAIERRANWIYHQYFVRRLRRHVRRKHHLYPHIYDIRNLRRVRTIRAFDERFTCPDAGYKNADDYYTRASARPLISQIRIPTLIIHAQDDPFIPFASFLDPAIAANPCIQLLAPTRGGHVGFLSDKSKHPRDEDAFWAENRVIEFFEATERNSDK